MPLFLASPLPPWPWDSEFIASFLNSCVLAIWFSDLCFDSVQPVGLISPPVPRCRRKSSFHYQFSPFLSKPFRSFVHSFQFPPVFRTEFNMPVLYIPIPVAVSPHHPPLPHAIMHYIPNGDYYYYSSFLLFSFFSSLFFCFDTWCVQFNNAWCFSKIQSLLLPCSPIRGECLSNVLVFGATIPLANEKVQFFQGS